MNEEHIEDEIEMLKEPLITEEGFLNEACMNELEAWVKNMPRTYERLSSDKEWSTPDVTNVKEITGAFAYWSVRQGEGYKCPPDLEKLVSYLDTCLRKEFIKKDDSRWGEMGYGDYSLCDINKMLFDVLWDMPMFMAWNTEECLGEHWLDLDALLHNVCLSIRDERRKNGEFDRKFEEKYGHMKDEDEKDFGESG